MGNTESTYAGNLQRSDLKPSSSFSAQRHIAPVDHGRRHGQSSPLDNSEAYAGRRQLSDDPSFGEGLVARGSSFVTSDSQASYRPMTLGSSTSNRIYDEEKNRRDGVFDKDNNRCDGIHDKDINRYNNAQRAEPVSTVSIKTNRKVDNSRVDMRKRNNLPSKGESHKTETNAVVANVNTNGNDHSAASKINANFGKRSRNMRNDLQVVQNVRDWNFRSKGRLAVAANESRSDDHKSIRERRSGKKVLSSTQMQHLLEQYHGRFPSSHCQSDEVYELRPGPHNENGPFTLTAEAQSVESRGFSVQCESEKQSLEEDSENFPSHPEQQFASIQKPEPQFSECKEPGHESSLINNSKAFLTSANNDLCDSVSVSVANSTRVPEESDDSFVTISTGFGHQCSLGNSPPQTHTPSFGSIDIDFERFADCFSFTKRTLTPDMTFGSYNPSMTFSHSQTLHNDTGQFDVQKESLDQDMSHSSTFSTSGLGLSGPLSKPCGEISETTSPPPSDTFRLKSVEHSSHNSITSQCPSFPSVRSCNSQDLENEQSCEPAIPEQDANITQNNEREMANDPKISADTTAKMRSENRRVQDAAASLYACSISKRENSAGFAVSISKTNEPTAFLPAAANSSTSPSQANQPNLTVTSGHVTAIACNGVDRNGNRRNQIKDVADFDRRNEEIEKNNNKDNEVPYLPNTYAMVPRQHGQQRMPQSRQPVESDADDHTAAAGRVESPRRHGFHVPLDDPGGAASAFLRPVPDILAVSDQPGNPAFYAAYLLVADADIENFGLPFLLELESWGLSIFFRNRDLILTGYEYENLSAIVEERCNGKVIVVVSSNYPQSPQCQYLTVFARNLDPDARRRNIIPVYIDKEIEGLPRVLKGLAIIRYNQVVRRGWLKDKILGALGS